MGKKLENLQTWLIYAIDTTNYSIPIWAEKWQWL